MNTHPNSAVVAAIGQRVEEWQEEQRLAVSDQPSKTEEVYKPIVDHGESYRIAFEKMTEAIRNRDDASAEKYFFEAQFHELKQREAGAKARAYFLSKVQA